MKQILCIMFVAQLILNQEIASAQIPRAIVFTVTVSDTQPPNSRGYLALVHASAMTKRFRMGDGTENSDLVLTGLSRGQTYSAVPNGAGGIVLTPNDGVATVSSPGQADIIGDTNAQVVASFVLPQRLYSGGDTSGSYVATQYASYSASWGSPGAEVHYFDPRNPISLSLDDSGRASIVIGGVFIVGFNTAPGTYEAEASLTFSSDTISHRIRFEVTVRPYQVEPVSTGDLSLTNLAPGKTYTATPDGAGSLTLVPNDGIAAISSNGRADFFDDSTAHIMVSFILPSVLYPLGGGSSSIVKVRFDSTSAAWGDSGAEVHPADPRTPFLMSLDSAGRATVVLGGIFQTDSGTVPDTYQAEALVIAENVTSVVQPPEAMHPRSFHLNQNYPNPFNPVTTIRYQVPTWGSVLLRIFDVMGREVATLVKDVKGPGEYIAKWDASSFSSGVYFYKLEAGLYSDVKKLVLLR